ncbi:hypothetical protein PIB30_041377 [Stylosanthes scabra]|uniref:Uncharacterized protein n=1 Tax=Stylosanthes scabra TaxID=79078 RepID=A0ABU6QEA1_9FABA|nr:hypothetical protein [Stylosanthes scabra]
MATINQPQITEQSVFSQPPSNSNPPPPPTTTHQIGMRKLGKHQVIIGYSNNIPSPSPSESPKIDHQKNNNKNKKMESSISEGSSSNSGSVPNHERNSVEEQPHYDDDVLNYKGEEQVGEHEQHLLKNEKQHHHAFDNSVAGGGVILGGLATTFLVSIFCYIKATGRKKSDISTSSSSL